MRFSTEEGQDTFEDSGVYSIIFPPDPVVWGVSHIKPRTVPPHIVRPPYALPGNDAPDPPSHQSAGKIKLGGEAEHKIREAALLAKKVREFAGTQIKVCKADVCYKRTVFQCCFIRLVLQQTPSTPPFMNSL
jgi:methionyl aminopeptidase